MKDLSKSLPIPEEVQSTDAHELLRVWDIHGKQRVSISSELGGEPSQFGQLLAQIALHSCQVYQHNESISSEDSLRQILQGFKEEVAKGVGR